MSFDVSMPWLLASLVVGTTGLAFLLYGKRRSLPLPLGTGAALLAWSYVAPGVASMLGGAGGVVAAYLFATRARA